MKTKFSVNLEGHKMDQFCIIPTIITGKNYKQLYVALALFKWCLEITIDWK